MTVSAIRDSRSWALASPDVVHQTAPATARPERLSVLAAEHRIEPRQIRCSIVRISNPVVGGSSPSGRATPSCRFTDTPSHIHNIPLPRPWLHGPAPTWMFPDAAASAGWRWPVRLAAQSPNHLAVSGRDSAWGAVRSPFCTAARALPQGLRHARTADRVESRGFRGLWAAGFPALGTSGLFFGRRRRTGGIDLGPRPPDTRQEAA